MKISRKKRLINCKSLLLIMALSLTSCLISYQLHIEKIRATDSELYYETGRALGNIQTKTIIVIDAGHGGIDSGSDNKGILEKDINLAIALKLQVALEEIGYGVLMTRDDDTALALRERSDFSNKVNAGLFISLHQNSYLEDSSVNGIEVYYNSNKTIRDKQLAQCIQQALVTATGAFDRGIREYNGLVVTRESHMPACLVETAFITNNEELTLITSDDYQNKVVAGIVQGIEKFLMNNQKGVKPANGA